MQFNAVRLLSHKKSKKKENWKKGGRLPSALLTDDGVGNAHAVKLMHCGLFYFEFFFQLASVQLEDSQRMAL